MTAQTASAPVPVRGSSEAATKQQTASPAWVATSQPRRRPATGGSNRSASGAQTNLKV